MKKIINSGFSNIRELLNCFFLSCIWLFTISSLMPVVAKAQSEDINSEYRVTFVPTYPINKKIFLTSYLGYVYVPNNKTTTYYIGGPLLVTYRINPVVEVMAGAFAVINNLNDGNDNTEFRPIAGLKLNLPNDHQINLFNWIRYELRSFYYDDKSLNKVQNRIRNRIGLEFPISKRAWQPKSYYALTDFELFYTIEKGYFDRFRERLGLGYMFDQHWRVEMIYHIQMLKYSKDLNPQWTDNIFRLNIKWSIPHQKHGPVPHPPDVED